MAARSDRVTFVTSTAREKGDVKRKVSYCISVETSDSLEIGLMKQLQRKRLVSYFRDVS